MKTTRPERKTSNNAPLAAQAVADRSQQATRLSAIAAMMNNSPRSMQMKATGASMNNSAVVQRVILCGTTHRSDKAYQIIRSTGWYKDLKDDVRQRFAVALHEETKKYTREEAEKEIDKRILRGDTPPLAADDEKAERKRRVTAHINSTAPSESSNEYLRGSALAQTGERAIKRLSRRYRRQQGFTDDVKTINEVEPGPHAKQATILDNRKTFEQIIALTSASPQSFNLDIGGSDIKLDALDVKSNKERSLKRQRSSNNLAQVFIEQPSGENSYWSMADSSSPFKRSKGHEQLRHLEVIRNNQSATTTYLKDVLLDRGTLDNREAFGDENEYTFQEFKGALKPSSNMRKKQQASANYVLAAAMRDPDSKLGKKIGKRKRTTPKAIDTALTAYLNTKTSENEMQLIREQFRLIRASTEMDIESDDSSDGSDGE